MSGYVYAISIEATPYVKIGYAACPEARLAGMQTCVPFKLELIYAIKVAKPSTLERVLHNMLDGTRIRGEWFEMPDVPLSELFAEAIELARHLEIEGNPVRKRNGKNPSTLGMRLAQARKEKEWTQIYLSEKADVKLGNITHIEQGHTQHLHTDTLLKLARALNISTDYLLGHKVKP